MGAWIETFQIEIFSKENCVAPLVGAWIETRYIQTRTEQMQSHPSWVRGLKPTDWHRLLVKYSRTPRGCVD